MARIIVSPSAAKSLGHLIATHSLPSDTKDRFKRSISLLGEFPRLGRQLEGAGYDDLRFILGPWRWMIIVYEHDTVADSVNILAVEDGRSLSAATNFRA